MKDLHVSFSCPYLKGKVLCRCSVNNVIIICTPSVNEILSKRTMLSDLRLSASFP